MTATSPWAQEVVRQLSRRGLAIHVIDFSRSRDAYLNANRDLEEMSRASLSAIVEQVHLVPANGAFVARVVRGAMTLRALARRYKPIAVLTLYGGLNAAIAYASGIRPYLVYVVGSDVLLADRLRRLVSRVSLSRAARVLANGDYLARKTSELAPSARVERLYLGVDLQRFHASTSRRITESFVCSRGFSAVYDNGTIIRAIALLPTLPADFRMRFLSTGPLLTEAIALADRHLPAVWRQTVSFAGGVGAEDMVPELQRASFYVSASLSDGSSASLLEAMACGLFPIVSDIPANREWIADGRNGMLFPPGDADALARAMQLACKRPPWMKDAIESNHRIVAERANIDASMERLADLVTMTGASKNSAQAT